MSNENFVQCDNQPTAEEITLQLETIVGSKHFRNAKSLERFLRYVTSKKLAGAEHELKEYSIGVEAFRRGDDFDPRSDAVVRVQASMMRKKLASFYGEEGVNDPVIIELPKGHYVPRFSYRQTEEATSDIADKDDESLNVITVGGLHQSGFRWFGELRIVATFVVGLLTAVLFFQWHASVTPQAGASSLQSVGDSKKEWLDSALLPLWESFLSPDVPTVLAYGTPQFFNSDGIYFRDVTINSDKEMERSTRLMELQKRLPKSLVPTETYTGVGETQGVYLLSKFFWKASRDLRVVRSRMVSWDDMKNYNLIFLSSLRFHTLAKELPFPTDFVVSPTAEGTVLNLRPQAGEQKEYRHTVANGTEYDHAVLTLWPGQAPNRRIMVLGGSNTWSTLAAAEFVTKPEYLKQLNLHLEKCRDKSGLGKHPDSFQVLLRVEIKDRQPVSIAYVTHHDFEIRDENTVMQTAQVIKQQGR